MNSMIANKPPDGPGNEKNWSAENRLYHPNVWTDTWRISRNSGRYTINAEAEKKQIRQTSIGTVKDLKEDGDLRMRKRNRRLPNYIEFKQRSGFDQKVCNGIVKYLPQKWLN